MIDGKASPAILRRLTAVLALHGLSVRAFATGIGISDAHLRAVLLGERKPSERVAQAIREHLGAAGWQFVRGQVDVLAMPGTKVP